MKPLVLVLAAATLAVAACGSDDTPADAPRQETSVPGTTAPGTPSGTDGATRAGSLIGVLHGDAQLEGGCAWVEPTGGPDAGLGDRLELVLPAGYTVEFEPDLRILDAQGAVVAERGDELVLDGAPAGDVMTVCQVGPAYQVEVITGTVGR